MIEIETGILKHIKQLEVIEFKNRIDFDLLTQNNHVRFNYKTKFFTYECLLQNGLGDNLFVILHGAKDREKTSPPYFDRWSWAPLFPGKVLNISDPTLQLDKELKLAWYLGNSDENPIETLADIIIHLVDEFNMPTLKIVLWGSSGGGFAALSLATKIEGALAVAINPQTCVYKYYKDPVNKCFEVCFPNFSLDEIIENFHDRLDMTYKYSGIERYSAFVVQDTDDTFHYKEHFLPFWQVFNKNEDNERSVMFYKSNRNHGPEPKEMVPHILDKIGRGPSVRN